MNALWLVRLATAVSAIVTIGFLAAIIGASGEDHLWSRTALRSVHQYALAERSLQRDLLYARAGLLRNYDPVNDDLVLAEQSLDRLRGLPQSPAIQAVIAAIAVRTSQQEPLVERFKSNNALLQNSLARFTATSNALPSAINRKLPVRILKLTLDTSPESVEAARAAIDEFASTGPRTEAARDLVAHANLLVTILPQIDATLQEFRALDLDAAADHLDAVVAEEARAREIASYHRQIALTGTTVVTLALLVVLLLSLRMRTRDLQRRAANEHLNATVAGLLIDVQGTDFDDRIELALQRLARHVGSTRAHLKLIDCPLSSHFVWPAADRLERDRFDDLIATVEAEDAWTNDALIRPAREARGRYGGATGAGSARDVLLIRSAEPVRAVLGFQSDAHPLDLRPDIVMGLTMALAAILQAARRQMLDAERIQLERQLARSRRMETIGQMASGVAHNFNNIIGAIGGFGEMAEAHTRTGSVARRNLNEIRRAVERARDLVDEILNFAKQDRGVKQPIDISRLVEEAVRLFHASKQDGVKVEFSTALVAGDVVGAAGQVQQVLLNILNNAASANSNRGPIGLKLWSVTVGRRAVLSHSIVEPGTYVVLTIVDYGTGISPTALPRIFEPFFTTRPGGTGLGLSTAWEIVQDHGGTIDVHSELGVGSRFNIWLPLAFGNAARQPASPPTGTGERILLLGSDETLAADEEILANLGYEPVGRAISAHIPPPEDLINCVDAIILANPTPDQLVQLRNSLEHGPAAKPLLIAADSARRVMCGLSSDTLRYPLQQAAVAPALSRLLHGADRMTASR